LIAKDCRKRFTNAKYEKNFIGHFLESAFFYQLPAVLWIFGWQKKFIIYSKADNFRKKNLRDSFRNVFLEIASEKKIWEIAFDNVNYKG